MFNILNKIINYFKQFVTICAQLGNNRLQSSENVTDESDKFYTAPDEIITSDGEFVTPPETIEEPEEVDPIDESEEEFTGVVKLNVNSYARLIYRLETYLESNPDLEYVFFSLRIVYELLGDRTKRRVTEERYLQNMRIRDMFNILKEDARRLEEIYDAILLDFDNEDLNTKNLKGAYLTKFLPKFGKGDKNFNMILFRNNELWSVIFPDTINKCVINCVYDYLGKSKTDRFFKNTNFKKLKFDEMCELIKEKLNKNIIIAQTLETIDKDIENYDSNTIYLYGRDGHVGYLKKGVEEFTIQKRKQKIPNFGRTGNSIMCGYDCEYSYDDDGQPEKSNLVCAVYRIDDHIIEKSFDSFDKFIMYTEMLAYGRRRHVNCYAHNAQKVENPFVLQDIVRMKELNTTEIYNFSGNKIKSYSYNIYETINKGKNKEKFVYKINFFDTLCYMKDTLDNISQTFNLETSKGHEDWPMIYSQSYLDSWYRNKKWSIKDPKDVTYCMNDSKIVLEFVYEFNEYAKKMYGKYLKDIYNKYNLENPDDIQDLDIDHIWFLNKASLPAILRAIFHNLHKQILNTSEDASLFKTAYYGGRTECFFVGETDPDKKVYVMDINSSYPYQMINGFAGEYKRDLIDYCSETTTIDYIIDTAKKNKLRWLAFAVLKYKSPMKRPLLAVCKDHKLIFPNIINPTLVPIWDCEYEAIKDNLDIISIEHACGFAEQSFNHELSAIADLKKTTRIPAEKAFAKLNLNSCYGILGMDNYRPIKKLVDKNSIDYFESSDFVVSEGFDQYKWIQSRQFTKVDAAFQSASSITAQARLHLWRMFQFVDECGHKLLYCDTDSVMFESSSSVPMIENEFRRFLHSSEFGYWDFEHHQQMKIFTSKVYYYKDDNEFKIKFKGLNNIGNINANDIIKNCEFKTSGTRVTKKLTIEVYEIIKKFTLEYNKGIVEKTGNVIPFEI